MRELTFPYGLISTTLNFFPEQFGFSAEKVLPIFAILLQSPYQEISWLQNVMLESIDGLWSFSKHKQSYNVSKINAFNGIFKVIEK